MTVLFPLFLLIGLVLFILHIALSVWVYRDAVKRGKTQEYALIVLVLTLVFPVMGPVVYLLIRDA